jgi:hypothetical protein
MLASQIPHKASMSRMFFESTSSIYDKPKRQDTWIVYVHCSSSTTVGFWPESRDLFF